MDRRLVRWATTLMVLIAACAGVGCAGGTSAAPEGFTALFDGRTLHHWRPFIGSPLEVAQMDTSRYAEALHTSAQTLGEHWKVEGGVIVTDGKGQNLCTTEDFGDFELLVDWKIKPGGDSGIYLRGSPQVQIWDRPNIGSGGLYNNEKNPSQPLVIADRRSGEWNTFRILMIGDHVTVFLNDVLTADNAVMENYWERDKPIYPTGAIELQAHGDTVMFRNIFVRRINSAP